MVANAVRPIFLMISIANGELGAAIKGKDSQK